MVAMSWSFPDGVLARVELSACRAWIILSSPVMVGPRRLWGQNLTVLLMMTAWDSLGENTIAAVVVEGRANVKALLSTVVPRAVEGGFAVVENPKAGGAHRHCIKVEYPTEPLPG